MDVSPPRTRRTRRPCHGRPTPARVLSVVRIVAPPSRAPRVRTHSPPAVGGVPEPGRRALRAVGPADHHGVARRCCGLAPPPSRPPAYAGTAAAAPQSGASVFLASCSPHSVG